MTSASNRSDPAYMLDRLFDIDWDFADADTTYLTHGLHPYPAKYIPQIPNAIIEELSSPGEVVADIFCGSGTTLIEALRLGRHAIGIDANPLACLISRAKTARLNDDDRPHLDALLTRAQSLSESIAAAHFGPLFSNGSFVSSSPRPADQAISFWFDPGVVEELAEALAWCRAVPSPPAREVALTAFSSIVVSVSRQDSDTRYVRREKNVAPGDVLKRFARSLAGATERVSAFTRAVAPDLRCEILNADILTQPDIGQVDLVVCSPPYPNAYSYHLYHMTRMLWMGMDQPRFKREEIGSHRKYSSKGRNGATADTFRSEMRAMFQWLGKHIKAGRFACFVVGDSIVRGAKIDNAELVLNVAGDCGFIEAARISRTLRESKKAFNPAIGKIKTERVLILQNNNGR